jgi:hypothetical protein
LPHPSGNGCNGHSSRIKKACYTAIFCIRFGTTHCGTISNRSDDYGIEHSRHADTIAIIPFINTHITVIRADCTIHVNVAFFHDRVTPTRTRFAAFDAITTTRWTKKYSND